MTALQIVVPMAGRGSRFVDAGYALPKPLIDVGGHPMIELVIANLTPRREHRFVFVAQRDQLENHGLGEQLMSWAPGSSVVPLDAVTEGAACTVLTARAQLDPAAPLMIANCDQWVDTSIDSYLDAFDVAQRDAGARGWIMTMFADDPKWSFAELGADGWVTRVVEKEVVSTDATVGIYNYARAGDFLSGADRMIAADRRVNGEFYVAPVYDELIAAGDRVGTYDIDRTGRAMHGLGTPADLEAFLASGALPRALDRIPARAR